MLKKILIEGAQEHSFKLIKSIQDTDFFERKIAGAERYLILKSMDLLDTIENIQSEVLTSIPESFSIEPSFNKNCDLVLIHKLKNLADFKNLENKILTYEENPYHFKKYFLYFSDSEERAIQGKNYNDFFSVVLKMDEFESYKKNPLTPSFYSLAARIFIKLPFLAVPRSKKTLQTLSDDVAAVVAEAGLQQTHSQIASHANTPESADALVKELINEELENI
ncbi:MAG: hypothetical protein PHI11_01765 [Gallionella sp.]|nr:hypothetical protein [Gallionella sp.]